MWFFSRRERSSLARARKRAASPRASVFLEFALVMPLVLMLSSALIEFAGFWDSQVMANHAAWQVGRIAMVRGSDGMHFDNGLHKKSETGIVSTNMPEIISKALQPWNDAAGGLDKFNDRAVLTTALLMMTCEMGYYGATPGTDAKALIDKLLLQPFKDIMAAIPNIIKEKIDLGKLLPGDPTGLAKVITEALNKIVDQLTKSILEPITQKISDEMEKLLKQMVGKIDGFISGDGAWKLLGREFYGAMKRIASEKDVKNIVKVEKLEKDPYIFSRYKPLGFPEIVDKTNKPGEKDEKVKSSKGWPPNNNALNMIHVEVSWPYERGWMFPVVSGYGKASDASAVRAKGHSLVLPQPDICNENLMATGGVAYAEGTYTNLTIETFGDLLSDMTAFMRRIQYTCKYRIHQETVSVFCHRDHERTTPYWGIHEWWDWAFNEYNGVKNEYEYHKWSADKHKVNDLYRKNWNSLTGGADFDKWENGKGKDDDCFKPDNYHAKDWMWWPDTSTQVWRYPDSGYLVTTWQSKSLEAQKGWRDIGLSKAAQGLLFFRTGKSGPIDCTSTRFVRLYSGPGVSANYANLKQDILTRLQQVQNYYHNGIRDLIFKEIADMDRAISGGGQGIGNDIIPSDTKDFINDPKAAQEKARDKWKNMNESVMKAWRELNNEIHTLRAGPYNDCLNAFNAWESEAGRSSDWLALKLKEAAERGVDVSGKSEDQLVAYLALNAPNVDQIDPRAKLDRVSAAVDALMKKYQECYEKEVALGRLLGLDSAQKAPSELDPKDVPGQTKDIDPVPEGSITSGSDDDRLGDKWKLQNGIWINQ